MEIGKHRLLNEKPAGIILRVVNQYYLIFQDNTEKVNIIKGFGVISVTPIFLCLGLVLILRHTASDF
jgi:hypothetical protein